MPDTHMRRLEYERDLAEAEVLIALDPPVGSPEANRLLDLIASIDRYERLHWWAMAPVRRAFNNALVALRMRR